MGYRSDVGLCLSASAHNLLEKAVAKVKSEDAEMFAEIVHLLERGVAIQNTATGCAAWLWENTKWYHEFQQVAFIMHFLDTLEYGEYLFYRVGEEDDDIERQGGFWENPFGMGLSRQIVFASNKEQ